MPDLIYNCPNCSDVVSVADSLVGQNLVCPHCQQEFYATPPTALPELSAEKLPFFKFSRRKMLKAQMDQLIADGEYSEADHTVLTEAASRLGLREKDIDKLRLKELAEEFKPLKARIYETAHVTDEDVAYVEGLGRKFHVTIPEELPYRMCREIYLMEIKGEFPIQPICSDSLMLGSDEELYFTAASGWGQVRSKTRGYSGMSVSIPTGIRGVRFRLGQLTPLRIEELTLLTQGVLHVTSKRLLFNGESRNTAITMGRIVGTSLFSDAIEIEKSAGRSDYFFMGALHGRYVSAIVRALKER